MEKLKDMERTTCHDCGVEPGQLHLPSCDTERCPKCGGQLLSCGCFVIYNGEDECIFDEEEFAKYEPDVWSGVMYEDAHRLAEEMDWYSKFVNGKGWVECDKSDPDASHDLNKSSIYLMEKWTPKLKKQK